MGQFAEQVDLKIQRLDKPAKRGHSRLVGPGQLNHVWEQGAFDTEQITHRHPDPALG